MSTWVHFVVRVVQEAELVVKKTIFGRALGFLFREREYLVRVELSVCSRAYGVVWRLGRLSKQDLSNNGLWLISTPEGSESNSPVAWELYQFSRLKGVFSAY